MKESAIDEFESMFRKAVVPAVNVAPVPVRDILMVASFSAVNDHALKIAIEVAKRHEGDVRLVFPLLEPHEDLVDEAEQAQAELDRLGAILNESGTSHQTHIERGDPEVVLGRVCEGNRPDLVIVPSPIIPHSSLKGMKVLCAATEYLLIDADVPTLLVKNDRVPAKNVFSKVLSIFGGVAKDVSGYNLVFSLTDEGGAVRMVNILDKDIFEEEQETLAATAEMDTVQASDAILKTRRERIEKIVKRLKEALQDRKLEVSGEFLIDDPIEKTREMIVEGYHSALVVRPPSGRRHTLASIAFSLAHEIDEVPILALSSRDSAEAAPSTPEPVSEED